jgi:type II secretory pathway pseudopilin PulG
MSLLEIMVSIAIMLVLVAIIGVGLRSVLGLDEYRAAQKLAVVYEKLQDEAVMRNRTYRIIYYLNQDKYVIEAGEPGALIAADPTARLEYEQQVKAKLDRMDPEEKQRWLRKNRQPFESLGEGRMEVQLPSGMRFGGVYTPQYGELVEPTGEDDEDDVLRVESYVMSNGFVEHTLIQLVDIDNPSDGYTIEVQPLSGIVKLHAEVLEPDDRLDFVPQEGPNLPN